MWFEGFRWRRENYSPAAGRAGTPGASRRDFGRKFRLLACLPSDLRFDALRGYISRGYLLLLLIGLGLASNIAAQVATPPPAKKDSLTLPSDFLPLPGTPTYNRNQQQRQITALVRGFKAVASAEAVVAGSDANPTVSVVIKLRPGAQSDVILVESMAQVILSAVPGLVPARLLLATAEGQVLYSEGCSHVAVTEPNTSDRQSLILLLGACIIVSVGAGVLVWRRRTPAPTPAGGDWAWLAVLREQQLEQLLADEMPELLAWLLSDCPSRVQRHLIHYARKRTVPTAPETSPTAEVRQVMITALREKARRLGLLFEAEARQS